MIDKPPRDRRVGPDGGVLRDVIDTIAYSIAIVVGVAAILVSAIAVIVISASAISRLFS